MSIEFIYAHIIVRGCFFLMLKKKLCGDSFALYFCRNVFGVLSMRGRRQSSCGSNEPVLDWTTSSHSK